MMQRGPSMPQGRGPMGGGQGSRSVFVGNIAYGTKEEDLRNIFSEVGQVSTIRFVNDKETGKFKGYAFCDFVDAGAADEARRVLDGREINGRPLKLGNADVETRPELVGGPGGYPSGGSRFGQGPADVGRRPGGAAGSGAGGSRFDQPFSQFNPQQQQFGGPGGPLGPGLVPATAMVAQGLGAEIVTHRPPSGSQNDPVMGVPSSSQPFYLPFGAPGASAPAVPSSLPPAEQIAATLSTLPQQQLYDFLLQLRTMAQQSPDNVRSLIVANPPLGAAILRVMDAFGVAKPHPPAPGGMMPPQQQQQPQGMPAPSQYGMMDQSNAFAGPPMGPGASAFVGGRMMQHGPPAPVAPPMPSQPQYSGWGAPAPAPMSHMPQPQQYGGGMPPQQQQGPDVSGMAAQLQQLAQMGVISQDQLQQLLNSSPEVLTSTLQRLISTMR